jgi:hypothetical protein
MTVKSMMMPQRFTLAPTRQDALLGVCNSPRKCMYALCGRRMFPNATWFEVNPNGATVTLGGFYYHYTVPKRAVACMAIYDKTGKFITDSDLKKAKVTLHLADMRACRYESTEAAREYHRKKSARRRADPDYVRPDSRNTLRAQIAHSWPNREAP